MAIPAQALRPADRALGLTVVVLWLLLALFVIYPLLMMLSVAFLDGGKPTIAPLIAETVYAISWMRRRLIATVTSAFSSCFGVRAPDWTAFISMAT